ncbi:MAG: hypothetical protein IPN77_14405 [Sandaracinaceae bacterium]|nr:hypothetical protein [Sandaracinaceae bacterium]
MPSTRFVASDANAMEEPSSLSATRPLGPLASTPLLLTLTRVVVPRVRSLRNTSVTPFVSFATRFVASLSKSTKRPSSLMPTLRNGAPT